ncbi:MAG: hypothetical protein J1F63_00300 [Oscillospiraceae bacterium]|nr:hypothetical protein [Oscillospiraceae bacterium]
MDVASSAELFGKVVVVTGMKEIPMCCDECAICTETFGGEWCDWLKTGQPISQIVDIRQKRLPDCPLRLVGR